MGVTLNTRFVVHQVFKDPRGDGYWSREWESFSSQALAEQAAKSDLKDHTWVIYKVEQVAGSKVEGV